MVPSSPGKDSVITSNSPCKESMFNMSPIKMDDPNTSAVDNDQYDIQEFTLSKEIIAPDEIAETIIKDDNNLEEIKIQDEISMISSPKK